MRKWPVASDGLRGQAECASEEQIGIGAECTLVRMIELSIRRHDGDRGSPQDVALHAADAVVGGLFRPRRIGLRRNEGDGPGTLLPEQFAAARDVRDTT